jgi:hypothetical protein
LRTFRLTDAELGALAAGRPTPGTLAELRKAQLSRNLLLLRELLRTGKPRWAETFLQYGTSPSQQVLADPVTGLYAATAVSMMRSGGRPPDRAALVDPSAPVLVTTCDGVPLRVRLEDADPLRDRFGLTPTGRLDDDAVAHWQRTLDDAWRLLVRRHRADAAILAAVLRVIVPVEPDPSAGGISATSVHAFGAVAMSSPASGPALAVGLVHETTHSLLNATTLLFDLVRPTDELLYSPWRDDPRPPAGMLHGAYAYLAVTRFHRAEAAAGGHLAAFEFARWRAAVVTAAESLLSSPASGREEPGHQQPGLLTAAGRRFVSALRDEADGWRDDPVDPGIARLAADANTDHRVRWRLRNLCVDPAAIQTLAEAWRAGRPAPASLPDAEVRPAPRRLEASARLDRVHARLRAADRGEPETRSGSQGDHRGRAGGGVRPGDDAWLGADHGAGQHAYLWEIENPESGTAPPAGRDAALAGLALVSASRTLRGRPEIVRDTWLALRRPPLKALLDWFDG